LFPVAAASASLVVALLRGRGPPVNCEEGFAAVA